MATNPHWTARSIEDFVFKISSDFVFQLVKKMDAERLNQREIAGRLGVSVGRVSQVLNNPGNLTLKKCVQYARILGMKTAVLAYDDGDPLNNLGPINSEIFYKCWQRSGSPRDYFELAEATSVQVLPNMIGSYILTVDFMPPQEKETRDFSFAGLNFPAPSGVATRTSTELRISK
jgi:transcriptional regulator with XRE-family HTH domain